MPLPPPITNLNIHTRTDGFYAGFNHFVAVGSKVLIGILILWAAVFPDQAGANLSALNTWLLAHFGHRYMYVIFFYIIVCIGLAAWPSTGRIHLGKPDEKPEFSRFSWFSMMFGAGIGIGMLTYATAEPIFHFSNNPDVICGTVLTESFENVRPAFKWSFLHWGFSAWACYALVGLALTGVAERQILDAGISSQLFETINVMLSPMLATAMSVMIVILLLTFLVTSADSAVLIINTIAAAGDASQKGTAHIILWGAALTLVIGVLLVAGGLAAFNTAMIIGALPFSLVMDLMGISLVKAIVRDTIRSRKAGDSD